MTDSISPETQGFSLRLRQCPSDELTAFAEREIMSGVPFIFKDEEDVAYFHDHVATALGLEYDACDVLIVGSAKTGFSLDPYNYFVPFHEKSDIDIIVISDTLFDEAWHTMLNWDYLTAKNRTKPEQEWLYDRHDEVWSGWHYPPYWQLRERGGMTLSFPAILKPLRDFSFLWFSTFRGLSRYRHHPEVPRHPAKARLYRTRTHAAMYHAAGLRLLRTNLMASE